MDYLVKIRSVQTPLNGQFSIGANTLVTNGKSPMPAFGKLGTISTSDIENVAAYILKKADAGW